MATFLSSNSYLGLIQEATRGTTPSSGSASWFPVSSPQVSPMQQFLRDEALRGSPVSVYDQVQGVRHDEVDFKTYLYADTFPWLITAVLGGNDNVTGAGPYTHKISVYNNPANGSQPASYSILDFDGANWFTMTGAQASDLTLTFGAQTAAEATVKFLANPYTSSATAPGSGPFASPSFTSEHMVPAWDTTVSIGGSSFTNVQEGEIKIDRKTESIFTMGSQAPYQNFAGPTEITGRLLLVVSNTSDVFSTGSSAYGLTRSPQATTITLTDPNDTTSSTNHSAAFQMTSCQFHDIKRSVGKAFTEIEVQFTANANTTDRSGATNSSTGYASVLFTGVNNTAAYQSGY